MCAVDVCDVGVFVGVWCRCTVYVGRCLFWLLLLNLFPLLCGLGVQ